MSTLVARGEVIDCSNPKLDIFLTVSGVKTNPFDLEFAIFDIVDPGVPVQTFPLPAGTFEPVDPANDCPVGQRISTGRFTAVWTVDLAEPLTNHKISWRFRMTNGGTQQQFEQPFNVVSIAGSVDPVDVEAFRCRFPDYSDPTQFPAKLISLVLLEAVNCLDPTCFEDKLEIAQQYYAAHLLAYATGGARAKGASSVSAGSASISWDTAKLDFSSTAYGQHFKRLARMCTGGQVLC